MPSPGVQRQASVDTARHARCSSNPFFRLGGEDHVIRVGPPNRVHAGEAAIVRRVVPELVTLPGREIEDPERQRVAAGERRAEESRTVVAARLRRLTAPATSAAAAAPARSVQRVVRRTVRIADASRALMRLLAERRARAANERDAFPVR
jgi:hypothetical protein